MDYQKHYDKLMRRAVSRKLDGYKERHHVIPRCMGGTDDKQNIVCLTPEEHYVAHQLLVMLHPGNVKLLWAAVAMTNGTQNQKRSNRLYGWLRRELAANQSERMQGFKHSEETKKRMGELQTGKKRRPHSDETKKKMSMKRMGIQFTDEHRRLLSLAKTGIKRGPVSESTRNKMRISNIEAAKTKDYSYTKDEDYRKAQSEKMKEIWAKRKLVNN